ncbi:hypothetical protein Acsp02_90640 [Actinoplanes sp. NBRC 103695]|nr:hypothetical protein Acsp02_90640 [Actinoplanes sp. NBRC 103695]
MVVSGDPPIVIGPPDQVHTEAPGLVQVCLVAGSALAERAVDVHGQADRLELRCRGRRARTDRRRPGLITLTLNTLDPSVGSQLNRHFRDAFRLTASTYARAVR